LWNKLTKGNQFLSYHHAGESSDVVLSKIGLYYFNNYFLSFLKDDFLVELFDRIKTMDIEKEIKRLKEQGQSGVSLAKMAKLVAKMLDQGVIGLAGKIFWDKKFQKLAEFGKLKQPEKDRIFNELVIAPLTLFMITLEAPDLRQSQEFRDYLLVVRDEIPKAHVKYLKNLRVEKKYLVDWRKLIKMRYEEYSKDKLGARQAMMEFKSKKKDLVPSDLEEINLFLPVFTVVVGCHHHICRSKIEGKDELFKHLIKHLSRFYSEFRATIEGAKITPWKKLQIKLRRLLNDLNEKRY